MQRVSVLAALLFVSACTVSNHSGPVTGAGIFREVDANPRLHDCAATEGNWARQRYPQTAQNFSFSGQLVAVNLAKDEQWDASAGVWGDFGDEHGPVLQIFAPGGEPSALRLVIKSGGEERAIARIALNQPVRFRYSVDGPKVRVEAGGSSFTFDRPSTRLAGMATSCSTGHFRFEKMKVQILPG